MADLTLRLCLHGHSEVKRDAVTQINEIIGLHFNSASRPNNSDSYPWNAIGREDLGCELLARFCRYSSKLLVLFFNSLFM